jgi:hypothetical protein
MCDGITNRALFTRFCRSHRLFSPSVMGRAWRVDCKLEDTEEPVEAIELDESSDTRNKSLGSGEGSSEYVMGGRLPFLVGRGMRIAPGCGGETSVYEAARFGTVRDGKLLGEGTPPLDLGFIGVFVNPKSAFIPVGSSRPTALTFRMNTPVI